MSTLAIIPARGGSKQVPRKNVRPLLGKPLIGYTIEHAKQSSLVHRVVVSTDDDEIADVSRTFGAEVVRRPQELATDTASSESALTHVLDELRKKEGYQPDLVAFFQCTSPIRDRGDVDRAIRLLQDEQADSLLSACRSHAFVWRREGGAVKPLNYDPLHRLPRQKLPPEYIENGSLYLFRPWVLQKLGCRLGGKIALLEMDYWSSFQIDSLEDFELCEWILRRKAPAP
jgi:CMP-N,N'-diacetyllegionaminic acid synthase